MIKQLNEAIAKVRSEMLSYHYSLDEWKKTSLNAMNIDLKDVSLEELRQFNYHIALLTLIQSKINEKTIYKNKFKKLY